jgi:hypothetical protein
VNTSAFAAPKPGLEAGLRLRRGQPWESTIELLETPPGKNMPGGAKFGSCALVAPSPSIRGKGLGPEIDSADVVVRMNRLPYKDLYPDLGNRTDIYFVNNLFLKIWNGVFNPIQEAQYIGGTKVNCKLKPEDCHFSAIVFQPELTDVITAAQWNQVAQGWRGTPFVVGRINDDLREALRCLASKVGNFASTGFATFLTLLPVCDTLRLYGFSGGETLDGHGIWGLHSLGREHLVMKSVGAGLMTKQDFPLGLCVAPGKPVPKLLKWFRDNLGSFDGRVSIQH